MWILLIVIVLFGAKKIPELAKGLGQGWQEFKKATKDSEKEIDSGKVDPAKPVVDPAKPVIEKHV